MKNLYRMFSFFAVVNLLALAIFIIWLWQTDRLSRERIETVREAFAMTNRQAEADAEAAAREAEARAEVAAEAAKRNDPPLASAATVESQMRSREQEKLAVSRIHEDRRLLMRQLDGTTEEIQRREDELEQDRQEWQAAVEDDRQRKTDEQFRKAVVQLESIPPKQAKALIETLVAQGSRQQAVAYLDAMKSRARARVFREFKSDAETRLATELLEELRTFGLPASALKETGNDTSAAAAN